MDKRGISLQLFILFIGICVGVIFGVGVKSMIIADKDNLIVSSVQNMFCKANGNGADCRLFLIFTIIVSLFMGLLIFVGEHNRVGNWTFGMWLYIIGWILGSSFIYFFV